MGRTLPLGDRQLISGILDALDPVDIINFTSARGWLSGLAWADWVMMADCTIARNENVTTTRSSENSQEAQLCSCACACTQGRGDSHTHAAP